LLFKEGNPVGVKAALHQLKICENELRLPLISASDELYNQIKDFVSTL
jgi:4-hydroxy-tetrahydrodipicolinate synthase